MVDNHNKQNNPNGRPYGDKKRSATVPGLPDGPQDTGVEIPVDSSAPRTAEELTTKDGPVSMITTRGQHLHFTKSSHLRIKGTSDDCPVDSVWRSSTASSSSMSMSRQRRPSKILCASTGTCRIRAMRGPSPTRRRVCKRSSLMTSPQPCRTFSPTSRRTVSWIHTLNATM